MMPTAVARVYLTVWVACHLIYPLWLVPRDPVPAALSYAAFCLAAWCIYRYMRPVLFTEGAPWSPQGGKNLLAALPDDPVLWTVLGAVVVTRLFVLGLPADGEGAGMAQTALWLKAAARHLPVAHPWVFWSLLVLAWFSRRALSRLAAGLARAAERGSHPVRAAVFLAAAVWFVLAYCGAWDYLPTDVLRAPPLPAWTGLPAFGLLGYNPLAGRLPEFLFYAGGGLFVYKLVRLSSSRLEACLAAAFFWLLPPISYYGTRGGTAAGELFFLVLTAYFYALWLKQAGTDALYWGTLALSIGSLYSARVLVAAPVLAGMVAYRCWKRPVYFRGVRLGTVADLLWMLAAVVLPRAVARLALGPSFLPELSSFSWEQFAAPAAASIETLSLPLLLILLAGAATALLRGRYDWKRYLLLWAAVHYLFVGFWAGGLGSTAELIRWSLPLYIPLTLWAAEGLVRLARGRTAAWPAGILLASLMFIHCTWFPLASMRPEFTLSQGAGRADEALPLSRVAARLEEMPEGAVVVVVDCRPEWFELYLRDPGALRWVTVRSSELRSFVQLQWLYIRERADMLVYRDGPSPVLRALKRSRYFQAKALFMRGHERMVVVVRRKLH